MRDLSFNGVMDYEYDAADRIDYVTFSQGATQLKLDYMFNERDELTDLTRYSDIGGTQKVGSTAYTYFDDGNTKSIVHRDGADVLIDDFHYTYDDADRLTSEISNRGQNRFYTYDDADQLTGDGSATYSYDDAGNRNMAGYVHDDANELRNDGTWAYSYDDEGNLTEKVHNNTGEVWNYGYDYLNRLTNVTRRPSSGPVDLEVTFEYDVLGIASRRLSTPTEPAHRLQRSKNTRTMLTVMHGRTLTLKDL